MDRAGEVQAGDKGKNGTPEQGVQGRLRPGISDCPGKNWDMVGSALWERYDST